MKTFWLTLAAASVFAAALQGCATAPGSYGRAGYTPPPGYILVPAPGDSGYYGRHYDWDISGIPSYYRGNPFYMPYYWYGYRPFYYVPSRPRQPCDNCDQHGTTPAPPAHDSAPPQMRPPVIEPRGDRRIERRFGRPVHPHVPEVPAFRRTVPGQADTPRPAAAPPASPARAVPQIGVPQHHPLPGRSGRSSHKQQR